MQGRSTLHNVLRWLHAWLQRALPRPTPAWRPVPIRIDAPRHRAAARPFDRER